MESLGEHGVVNSGAFLRFVTPASSSSWSWSAGYKPRSGPGSLLGHAFTYSSAQGYAGNARLREVLKLRAHWAAGVEEREKAGTHFFGVAVPNILPDAVIPALSLARRDAHFASRRPEQVLPVLSAEEKIAAAAHTQSAAPSEHREELSAQPAGASSDDGSDSLVADGEVEALAETTPGQDENAIGDAAEEGGDGQCGCAFPGCWLVGGR